MTLSNWRFNPFTELFTDVAILDEVHTVAFDTEANAYGFRLNEGILLKGSLPFNNDSDYEVRENNTGGSVFLEVPRVSVPSSGQFVVDYDAEGYHATSFVQFNILDNGKEFTVKYRGTGTAMNVRNISNAIIDKLNSEVFSFLNKRVSFRFWQGHATGSNVATPNVATDGNIYVIVGKASVGTTKNYYSYDLVTWTEGVNSFTGGKQVFTLKYANGIFLAAGENGELETSTDGITFTARTSTFGTDQINDSHYDATSGLWVVVGNAGKLATSPTGVTWTSRTSTFGATNIDGVTSDGLGHWLISETKTATSNNGTSWTAGAFNPPDGDKCAYGNGRFIIHGGQRAYWSTDRTNFTLITGSASSGGIQYFILKYDPDQGLWLGVTTSTDVPLVYSLDDLTSRFGAADMYQAPFGSLDYDSIAGRWLAAVNNNLGTSVWVSEKPTVAEI